MGILDILKDAIEFKTNELNGVNNANAKKQTSNVTNNITEKVDNKTAEVSGNNTKDENEGIYTDKNSTLRFLPFDEIAMCIKLQKLKGYKGSIQEKIVDTLAHRLTKKCSMSNKQRYYIEWGLAHFKDENKEKETGKEAGKETSKAVTVEKPAESNAANQLANENVTVNKDEAKTEAEKVENKAEAKVATGEIVTSDTAEVAKEREVKPYEIVFTNDKKLFSYRVMTGRAYIVGLSGDNKDKELNVTIPDKIKDTDNNEYDVVGIMEDAFKGCRLTSVQIGRNIVEIGKGAFRGCTNLRYVDLSLSSIRHIASCCFYNDKRLQLIKLASGIERIHESAFYGCKSLKAIMLPNSLDTIANKAFYGCISLKKIIGSVNTIGDSAFKCCINLKEVDFSKMRAIGPSAFALSGLENIVIPSNVSIIGNRAFSDCPYLNKVVIEEGVSEIGEWAFSKNAGTIGKNIDKHVAINSIDIYLPKSLKSIEQCALNAINMAYVYMGSSGESFCIRWKIPHTCIDEDKSKFRTDRDMNAMLGDPMLDLWRKIQKCYTTPDKDITGPNSSDPDNFDFDVSKLTKYTMDKEMVDYLGIADYSQVSYIEPHVKFKGYLKLVTSIYGENYLLPLTNKVTRLVDTFNTDTEVLFDDGYNRIVKVINTEKDTLEKGGFVAAIQGNNLLYVAPLSYLTDVKISSECNKHDRLIVDKVLYNGSNIGKRSAILGTNGRLTDRETNTEINVGLILEGILHRNAVEITLTEKDSIWYLPAINRVLQLHDAKEYEGTGADKKLIGKTDYSNLGEILDFNGLIEFIKRNNKFTKWYVDSYQFYDRIASMSDDYVAKRIKELKDVRDAKVSFMWRVSRAIVNKVGAGKNAANVYPDDLSKKILIAVANTHLMVKKELDWVKKIGARSLNKKNQYTVENLIVDEYVSNQVVKFSNSYMSGCKGAYVFIIREGNKVHGVYSSTLSMKQIVEMLYEMNNYNSKYVIKDLITKADKFDLVADSLFYHIASVAKTDKVKTFNLGCQTNFNPSFNISVYKPTGLLYLTTNTNIRFDNDGNRLNESACVPLVPIGYLNRALVVATTTNKNVRTSKLLTDLSRVTDAIYATYRNRTIYREAILESFNNMIETRKLLIAGEHDISKYTGITNDRIRYMMGTVPKTLENDEDGTVYMEVPEVVSKRSRRTKAVEDTSESDEVGYIEDDSDNVGYVDDGDDEDEVGYIEDSDDENEITVEDDNDSSEDEVGYIEDDSDDETSEDTSEDMDIDITRYTMFKEIAMKHGITDEDEILKSFKEIEAKRKNS